MPSSHWGRPVNVLFLCNQNVGRSLFAQALLEQEGQGHFNAYSAGSQPGTEIHPIAKDLMQKLNMPVEKLYPKSWDEFAKPGAPHMDFIITLCDETAGESCPVWPGHPTTALWSIDDPKRVEGNEVVRYVAFEEAFRQIRNRIGVFVALPFSALDTLGLKREVDEIGDMA